jgi:uncharacterized RDD family membrane protein YckC
MQSEELLDDFYFTPEEDSNPNLIPASVGQRLANCIIDYIVVQTLIYLAAVAIDESNYLAKIDKSLHFYVILGLVFLPFVYFWVCEYFLAGRTLGKLISGSRVVSNDGTNASAGNIVVRTLARLMPFEAFSIFINDDRIMWHDRWSHTLVVNVKKSTLPQ